MSAAKAIRFIQSLRVPTGPLAGRKVRLAPFQRAFIEGLMGDGVTVGVLSVARGGGKSTLTAGLALGHLVGVLDKQPAREILIGARNAAQAGVAMSYAKSLAQSLPEDILERMTFRRAPRLSISYEDDNGEESIIRAVPAVGASVLGTSPTFAIGDERAAWPEGAGEELEQAFISGLGKRSGRLALISTSAASDAHPFSRWLDEDAEGVYRQEHRPAPGLPPDDLDSLLIANPGSEAGIGPRPDWLVKEARRAMKRGGSALSGFRNFNRNERVASDVRDMLVTLDQWLAIEVETLPPREGECIVGLDLGGARSMSAACLFWPATGRLEAVGAFPTEPDLLNRGRMDGVGDRYEQMRQRGELIVAGAQIVDVRAFLGEVWRRLGGAAVGAVVSDRFRQAEAEEAFSAAQVTAPRVYRGMGWRDGSEDVERFRRHVAERRVAAPQSLLLRSALADAICVRDDAGNYKISKGRAMGRIDAACAATLAIAEGQRRLARPAPRAGRLIWA